jgi:hypothetical protein
MYMRELLADGLRIPCRVTLRIVLAGEITMREETKARTAIAF